MKFEVIGVIEQIETIAAGQVSSFGHFFERHTDAGGGGNEREWPTSGFRMAISGESSYIGTRPTGSANET